ncbi:hypothetical protein JD969_17110 [Planctomycetota bacterium]|nr:hypothetical protein JD969_17110 [Planctomycetota bacterium]
MTANGTDLLRMLEPAVRPVNVADSHSAKAANQPFERQDFDQLLHEAKLITAPMDSSVKTDSQTSAVSDSQANILSDLSRIDSVENASLRAILNPGQNSDL